MPLSCHCLSDNSDHYCQFNCNFVWFLFQIPIFISELMVVQFKSSYMITQAFPLTQSLEN